MLFISSAYANELSDALTAYEQGDYQSAFSQLSSLAEQNNTEAQYNLAFMYFSGDGIPNNDIEAVHWFEKAAKSGHAQAQDILAYLYLNGRGVEKDRITAYAWYRVSAENGVFLANQISKNLYKKMNTEERILADKLSIEFIKKYKNE